jgi:hypothetical protein
MCLVDSMNLHIGVMAHAIPNTTRVAFATVEVFPVKQSMLVAYGVLQSQTGFTMRTGHVSNSVFLHDAVARGLVSAHPEPADGLMLRCPAVAGSFSRA